MDYRTFTGEPFQPRQIFRDGVKCRACFRVIRVRENAGYFSPPPNPMSGEKPLSDWVCRDCLYDEPLTVHNTWRKDHAEHRPDAGNSPRGEDGSPGVPDRKPEPA